MLMHLGMLALVWKLKNAKVEARCQGLELRSQRLRSKRQKNDQVQSLNQEILNYKTRIWAEE